MPSLLQGYNMYHWHWVFQLVLQSKFPMLSARIVSTLRPHSQTPNSSRLPGWGHWTNISTRWADGNVIFWGKQNYSISTMASDGQVNGQLMYPLNYEGAHMVWALSCLSLSNSPPRFTSILAQLLSWIFFKKGWGFLDQVEFSTISVDPVQLLASMAAACCVN